MVVDVVPPPLDSILLIRRLGNNNRKSSAFPGKILIMSSSCSFCCKINVYSSELQTHFKTCHPGVDLAQWTLAYTCEHSVAQHNNNKMDIENSCGACW